MLKASATKISDIEKKLTALEEEYPEVAQLSMDSDMSMSADSDMSMASDDGSIQRFPAFEGKDLDGNTVKSDRTVLRQCCHRGELLVYHLQPLRRRACRVGRAESRACREGRRTHWC